MDTSDDKEEIRTLHNPVKDRGSGTIWPIFLFMIVGSFGWFLSDPELRRGLAEITGLKALAPIVEEFVSREFTITLYGTYTSTCTQRVMAVAKEKDLDIDLRILNMTNRDQKAPHHLSRHPFGQIPVLELEDGQYIYESRAISQYLVKRWSDRGTPLLVSGLLNEAHYDQALSIEAFDFDPLASSLVREAVILPRTGALSNEVAISAARTALEGKLDVYETILSHSHWLAGPNLTLADLYHIPYGAKIVDAGHGEALTDTKKRPHVAKWWKSLHERASWKGVIHDVHNWQEAERKEQEEREAVAEKQHVKEVEKEEHKHKHNKI